LHEGSSDTVGTRLHERPVGNASLQPAMGGKIVATVDRRCMKEIA
jgi:hypothetical protein